MKKVVSEVGGHDLSQKKDTVITQAAEWFLAHYPLLGGLASSFKIIEDIAGRVEVTGRGGTILQPGVDALEKANNFPVTGPILIITDGYIENNLKIKREHAYLIPNGRKLPFRAQGKIFYMKNKERNEGY